MNLSRRDFLLELGGYLTCLDRGGTPYDTFRQMWMQWREVWMFARQAHEPAFLDWFRKGDDFCDAHMRDGRGPEWFAYAAVDGRQFHSYKGSRLKGFFHIPRHLLDTVETCDRILHKSAWNTKIM